MTATSFVCLIGNRARTVDKKDMSIWKDIFLCSCKIDIIICLPDMKYFVTDFFKKAEVLWGILVFTVRVSMFLLSSSFLL